MSAYRTYIVSECIPNIRNATERVQITLIETTILNEYSFRNNRYVFHFVKFPVIFSMEFLNFFLHSRFLRNVKIPK